MNKRTKKIIRPLFFILTLLAPGAVSADTLSMLWDEVGQGSGTLFSFVPIPDVQDNGDVRALKANTRFYYYLLPPNAQHPIFSLGREACDHRTFMPSSKRRLPRSVRKGIRKSESFNELASVLSVNHVLLEAKMLAGADAIKVVRLRCLALGQHSGTAEVNEIRYSDVQKALTSLDDHKQVWTLHNKLSQDFKTMTEMSYGVDRFWKVYSMEKGQFETSAELEGRKMAALAPGFFILREEPRYDADEDELYLDFYNEYEIDRDYTHTLFRSYLNRLLLKTKNISSLRFIPQIEHPSWVKAAGDRDYYSMSLRLPLPREEAKKLFKEIEIDLVYKAGSKPGPIFDRYFSGESGRTDILVPVILKAIAVYAEEQSLFFAEFDESIEESVRTRVTVQVRKVGSSCQFELNNESSLLTDRSTLSVTSNPVDIELTTHYGSTACHYSLTIEDFRIPMSFIPKMLHGRLSTKFRIYGHTGS